MAEESGGSSWWGAWGTEFLENMKAKSSETMAMVKQDLSEFMCTVQNDATSAIADTATVVKDQLKVSGEEQVGTSGRLKQGMSDWFGTISLALKDNISQVANTAAASFSESDSPVFDRFQARLNEIQTDPTTYCADPDGHPHMYDEWHEQFDLEQCKGEISELLVNKPKVRALYTNLVPSAVSHSLFWQRYFYKVHQLNQEEKKRAALVERANKVAEEDLGWGDDEDDMWDTEENNADSPEQPSTGWETSEKIPSVEGTEDDRKNIRGSVTEKADDGIESKGAKSSGDNHLEELQHAQGTENDSKDIVTFSTGNTKPKSDDGPPTKDITSTNICGTVDKKKSLETSVPAERNYEVEEKDDGDNKKAAPDTVTLLTETERSKEAKLPSTSGQAVKQQCDSSKHEEVDGVMTDETDLKLTGMIDSQHSSHQRASSSGSVDSSWSKLSEETSHDKAKVSLSKSSSSSSGVLVPSVNDKDVEWDDDLDLDEDISEEEVKKIMESIANKDLGKLGDLDLDDDDWDNWE